MINKNMIIGDVLKVKSGSEITLMEAGLHCLGCPSSQMETLEEACMIHGIEVNGLIDRLNQE